MATSLFRHTTGTVLLALLATSSIACKDSGPNTGKTTDALAEEFTDGIEFDNDSIEDGPPPDSNTDTPFVRGIEAPNAIAPAALGIADSVDYEVQFDIVLDTYGTPLDDGSVQAVLAHVIQANVDDTASRHHLITPDAVDFNGTQVTLRATLHRVADFEGHAFTVRFALLLTSGDLAPWVFWNVVIYPPAGQQVDPPMCACTEAVTFNPTEGYDFLDSTNLTLPDTCQDSTLISYFYGDIGYDAGPCSYLMEIYYYEGPIGDFLFPHGTRFPPNGRSGTNPWACAMQIACQ